MTNICLTTLFYHIDEHNKNFIKNDTEILPIHFQANSGYDGPTVCEHSTLHATMACNGYDKIYINPAMICRY